MVSQFSISPLRLSLNITGFISNYTTQNKDCLHYLMGGMFWSAMVSPLENELNFELWQLSKVVIEPLLIWAYSLCLYLSGYILPTSIALSHIHGYSTSFLNPDVYPLTYLTRQLEPLHGCIKSPAYAISDTCDQFKQHKKNYKPLIRQKIIGSSKWSPIVFLIILWFISSIYWTKRENHSVRSKDNIESRKSFLFEPEAVIGNWQDPGYNLYRLNKLSECQKPNTSDVLRQCTLSNCHLAQQKDLAL